MAYIAVISLVVTGPVGIMVDRFGPRPVMIVFLGITSVGVGSLALVDSLTRALLSATIIAIGQSGVWAPQSALYARVTSPEHRQKLFGLQFMMLNLGLGLGGLISAVLVDVTNPSTFTVLYALDALTFLVYLVILLPLKGVGTGPGQQKVNPGTDANTERAGGYRLIASDRAMRHLVLASLMLLIFGYGSLEVGLPIFATVIGNLDASFLGVAYGVNTIVIVLSQLFVIKYLRGKSRSKAAALVGVFWALAWFIVGLSIQFPPIIAAALISVGVAIFAIGETFWSPVIPAIVNDLAPENLRGRYNAVLSLTWGLSGTIGPAVAGIMLGLDLPSLWITLVVSGCAISGFFLLRLRKLLTSSQDGMITI